MINNNYLAIGAFLLIILSVSSNYYIIMKAEEMETPAIHKITGEVTGIGIVNLTITRPMSEFNTWIELNNDNETVTIYWIDFGQDNVSLYITDNITEGFNIGNPNVSGITAYNWTDTTAGSASERYYKLGLFTSGHKTESNDVVGKYDIEIKVANGDPTGYELNQISMPLIPENTSFDNIVRGGNSGDIVLRFNTTDLGSTFEGWETNLKMGNIWLKQFDQMSPLEGYIFINVQNPYNLTIVGDVPSNFTSIPMVVASGSPAGYEMMLLGWNSLVRDCNLSRALNTTTDADSVLWFSTNDSGGTYDGWQTYLRIGNNWLPSGSCMEPGKGYRFPSISNNYTWNYDRTI